MGRMSDQAIELQEAEMPELNPTCGCDARFLFAEGGHSEPGATEVVFCSLHEAAGALLEAAEAAVLALDPSDNMRLLPLKERGVYGRAAHALSTAIKQARNS